MASSRIFPKVQITPKGEAAAKAGHPWVYADEITNISGDAVDGEIVDVYSPKMRYIGSGFYNSASKIRVRIISNNANDRYDEAFFCRRVKYAIDYRRCVMGDDFSSCRLIFGEADQFPGFTVDKFENVLVAQVACLGIEKRREMLYSILLDELRSIGIKIDYLYERCDIAVRILEGMEQRCGYVSAEGLKSDGDGTVQITENGIKYKIDYINGQKTGFFLDQKYNRLAAGRIAKGKRVLDCFTHTGAFGLNAAALGALSVTSVDISADAVEATKYNAALNGLDDKITVIKADVFDFLTELERSKTSNYDYIILDPPAFTKSNTTLKNAIRGYKEINMKAMKLLPRGGYLATCSCSHFMRDSVFCRMLHDAAHDVGVSLRQIESRQQAPDHPILWNVPETDYLKFYIFQIV